MMRLGYETGLLNQTILPFLWTLLSFLCVEPSVGERSSKHPVTETVTFAATASAPSNIHQHRAEIQWTQVNWVISKKTCSGKHLENHRNINELTTSSHCSLVKHKSSHSGFFYLHTLHSFHWWHFFSCTVWHTHLKFSLFALKIMSLQNCNILKQFRMD